MWIRSLTLRDAPGVPALELPELRPGVTVIVGPNASGKSTLARALRSLFDPESRDGTRVEIVFEHEGERHVLLRPHGTAARWPDSASASAAPIVPRGLDPRLHTLDLSELTQQGETDAKLARSFTRELFGGIDLEAARKTFPERSPSRGADLSRVKRARLDLDAAQKKTSRLAAAEARLATLREQRDAAREARRDAEALAHLAELVRLREESASCEAKLAALDPAITHIEPDAPERLQEFEDELATATAAFSTAMAACTQNARRRDRLAFPEALAAPGGSSCLTLLAEAKTFAATASALRGKAQARDTARKKLEEARATERSASEHLFAAPDQETRGGPDGDDALKSTLTLDDAAALDRAVIALLETEATLSSREQEGGRAEVERDEALEAARSLGLPDDPRALQSGVTALLAWLSLSPERHPRAFAFFTTAALVGGMGLGVLIHALVFWRFALAEVLAAIAALAGLGVSGALLPRLFSRDPATPARAREETAARKAGVAPERFTRPEVEKRLAQIFEVIAKSEILARSLDTSTRQVDEIRARLERAKVEARALAGRLGLSPELPSLPAHERAHRLITLIEAKHAMAQAAAELARLDEEMGTRSKPLLAFLEAFGLEAGRDLVALEASLDALTERLTKLDILEAEAERLEAEAAAARGALDHRQQKINEAFAAWKLAPDERTRLVALAARRPEHDTLETRLAELRRDREQLLGRFDPEALARRLSLSLDTLDLGVLESLRETLRVKAEREDEICDEVSSIESQVNLAGEGDALARARAEHTEALLALEVARDTAIHHLLAHLCLDDAVARFETEHRPARLERACALFSRFTRDQWTLDVDHQGATFGAVDTALGLRRTPAELSEGTRVHLLLAVRLAAIEAAERGGSPLPLCLDELLSTTDPERFEEIAGALFSVAREGRQIFYLTADPAEAAQWQAVARRAGIDSGSGDALQIVSLNEGRVRAAWGSDLSVAPSRPAEVPAPPSDGNADTYARKLNLPPPDAHRPASAWHLLHLLPDHLGAMQALVTHGADTLGRWRAAREALGADARPPFVSAELAALIEARGALLEATLASYRTGRGRPLRWADLEDAQVVTPSLIEPVRAALDTCRGDTAALLALLDRSKREKTLRGFGREKRLRLATFLCDEGYLPDGTALDPTTIIARVLATTEHARGEPPHDLQDARAFVAHLLKLLDVRSRGLDADELQQVGDDDA